MCWHFECFKLKLHSKISMENVKAYRTLCTKDSLKKQRWRRKFSFLAMIFSLGWCLAGACFFSEFQPLVLISVVLIKKSVYLFALNFSFLTLYHGRNIQIYNIQWYIQYMIYSNIIYIICFIFVEVYIFISICYFSHIQQWVDLVFDYK